MKLCSFSLLFLSTLLPNGLAVEPGADPQPAARRVPSFELTDQYEDPHQVRFPSAKVMVIVVADRKGASEIDGWIRPLVDRFGDQIRIAGIADMSKVPAMLRSFVRKRFLQQRKYPVMLDWEGHVARDFRYRADHANVYVAERQGRLTWHVAGPPDATRLRETFLAVENALSTARPVGAAATEAAAR